MIVGIVFLEYVLIGGEGVQNKAGPERDTFGCRDSGDANMTLQRMYVQLRSKCVDERVESESIGAQHRYVRNTIASQTITRRTLSVHLLGAHLLLLKLALQSQDTKEPRPRLPWAWCSSSWGAVASRTVN